ncbi:MAG TPA: TonB-dependent receptor, partial [Bryobacteraceae bacterium]
TGAASISTDPLGRPIFQGEIYDPGTQRAAPDGRIIRDPFGGQQIPVTSFDPVAAKIQALFPQPLGPNANSVVNNFVPNIPTTRVTSIPAIKIDQAIGSKGKLSFFFNRTNTVAPLSFTFGMVNGLPDPLATNRGTFTSAPLYRLNYDYSLTPTILLHFGAGYRQTNFYDPTVDEEGNPANFNAEQLVGLKGGTTHQFFPDFAGVCTPGPGTGSCTGQGGMQIFGSSFFAHSYTQSPTFNSNMTWIRGNHSYKIGAEFRTEGYPGSSLTGTSGEYFFSGNQTSLPYLNGTTLQGQTPGFAYASFLLGQVNQIQINNPVSARIGKSQSGVYAQDSWKITRKLTLDYGLRYDYSTYLKEQYGRAADFSPTTINPAVNLPGAVIFEGDLPGHCQCTFAKNYPFAFSPRLGLAYQITPKTVFRSGFGIVYDGTEANNNSGAGSSTNVVGAPTFGGAITTLSQGIASSFNPPAWPNLNPGQYNAPVNGIITPIASPANLIDPNAGRPPRQYQWSAGFQREIMRDLAVDVSYIGSRGMWWQAPGLVNYNALSLSALNSAGININNPTDVALLSQPISAAAVVARGFKAPYVGFPTSSSLGQALRPFPQFTTINTLWAPLGDNWYDGLQVKATKRLSRGLSFVSTFTWSKTLVSAAESAVPLTAANGVINDVFNRVNNKTLSSSDQPFYFNISATYVTPTLHGNKILSWAGRDWTYGVYLQYASGTPIAAPAANNNLATALFQTTVANRVPGVPLYTVDLNCHCYDPNKTFALNPAAWVDPAAGQFGTSAAYYNDYRTQRRPQENMNLGRTWRIKEKMTFNLRFEVTDAFNRGHYNNPTSTNAKATQTLLANGNAASGFGYLSPATAAAPRNGLVVGRFTF